MRPWEIWTADIFGDHPCVLVSNARRIELKPQIVVLKCTTLRPGSDYEPGLLDAVLDQADGLETKTRVQCDLLFTVDKAKLGRRRGEVSHARRSDIARKIVQGLAIAGL